MHYLVHNTVSRGSSESSTYLHSTSRTMSTEGRYYKLQMYFKKDGVSDADFHELWEQHGRVITTQIPDFKQYVKRYSQVSRFRRHCPEGEITNDSR